jgi:Tol biopolymer transport system component/DNA-binding winged helix-turn-helix (wHTH) protein
MKGVRVGIYVFDGFRLDAEERALFGPDGERMPLTPRVFGTLLYLVAHSGKVIGKDELMREIWADSFVEENNLNKNISLLRRTLGEKPGENRFIATVPGRGYKFVALVRELSAVPSVARPVTVSGDSSRVSDSKSRYDIEQHGNVFAVVEWAEPLPAENREASPLTSDGEISDHRRQKKSWPRYLTLSAFAVVAVLVSVGVWKFTPGGKASPAAGRTYTFLTNGVEVAAPVISPDGKYFVYSSFDGEYYHMWLQQVGQSERIEKIAPTTMSLSQMTFSPDGQFIYFCAAENGELSSLYRSPTFGKITTKIVDFASSPASFSPNGSQMTFGRFDENTKESSIHVANSDGSNERVILRSPLDRLVTYPTWSPDGKLIAFEDYPSGSGCSFAGINPDTGEIRSLFPERWNECYRMDWTADGKGIVFAGTRLKEGFSTRRNQVWYLSLANGKATRISNEGSWYEFGGITRDNFVLVQPHERVAQVWAMDAGGDSRSAVQLTSGRSDGRPGIAPLADGRVGYIARNDDKLELWMMNADGSDRKLLLNEPSAIQELRATADGKYFIFSVHRDDVDQLFRVDADGTNLTQLTFEQGIAIDSTVSPDGRSLVYSTASVSSASADEWLQRTSIDGGQPIPITSTDFVARTPHFSPDGQYLSFITADNKIGLVNSEGGSPIRVFNTVNAPRLNVGARWMHDGQALAYIVHRNNVSNIWLQPLDGGQPRSLTDFTSGDIFNFAFSTDGSRLYLARGYQSSDALLIKNFVE